MPCDPGSVDERVEGAVGDLSLPAVAGDVEDLLGRADLPRQLEAAAVDFADGDARTHGVGDLGGHLADEALAGDQDPFAHAQVGVAAGVHGDAGHAEERGVGGIDVRRQFDEQAVFAGDDKFHVVGVDVDEVAGGELCHVGAGLDDAPDVLVAPAGGQRVVGVGVVADGEVVVLGAVGDAGVERAALDLVAGRRGRRGPVVDERFFTCIVGPEPCDQCAHGAVSGRQLRRAVQRMARATVSPKPGLAQVRLSWPDWKQTTRARL